MPWINWQSWDYQRYPTPMSVLFSWNDHAKIQGKNNLQKRMNMIHSPQTHILFCRKKKATQLDFDPVDFGDSGGKMRVKSPFPLCKKKIVPRVGTPPKSESQNVGVCGTMHQIRIVNVFGWIKGIIVHQPPIEKIQSQVVKSFWEDSILDYPSFNLILFGWRSSPKNPKTDPYIFLSPLGNSIFHFPASETKFWAATLKVSMSWTSNKKVKHAKQKKSTWRWLM